MQACIFSFNLEQTIYRLTCSPTPFLFKIFPRTIPAKLWTATFQKLTTFANPRCSRVHYRGLILEIILKVQLQTEQPTIYSYFSGPVLNNELFFANYKRLPIFVNQTIVIMNIPQNTAYASGSEYYRRNIESPHYYASLKHQ